MDRDCGTLTVFFEEPFWVGLFERVSGGRLSVCKVTFGAEPRDCEVWEFVLREYDGLDFSPTVEAKRRPEVKNPKRRQRKAGRMTETTSVGTRSQQALQLQREASKAQRKQDADRRQEAEKQKRFVLKQQKRKEKHKGR